MIELKTKTLKDIESPSQWDVEDGLDIVSKDDLKQEAIRWVKIFNIYFEKDKSKWGFDGRKNYKKECGIDEFDQQEWDGIITFIKHFFNLTEEDLK